MEDTRHLSVTKELEKKAQTLPCVARMVTRIAVSVRIS